MLRSIRARFWMIYRASDFSFQNVQADVTAPEAQGREAHFQLFLPRSCLLFEVSEPLTERTSIMYFMWEVCVYSHGFLRFVDPFSAKIAAKWCNDALRRKSISKKPRLFLILREFTALPPLHFRLKFLLEVHWVGSATHKPMAIQTSFRNVTPSLGKPLSILVVSALET